MNFVIRGEAILIGFLQGFFSQEKLFKNIPNEFRFVDNIAQNSLIIEMSESFNDETINAAPAIIIQEGGFSEIMQSTGSNMNFWGVNSENHVTPFMHSYTLHCISQTKASSKLLQAAVAKSIVTFRKAIYEMGVDNISTLNGMPPMRMSSPDETIPGYYNSAITLQMKMDQSWISDRTGDPIEVVRITFYEACMALTLDDNGIPTQSEEEWIEQNITIDW